jgi:hypothetical protein
MDSDSQGQQESRLKAAFFLEQMTLSFFPPLIERERIIFITHLEWILWAIV